MIKCDDETGGGSSACCAPSSQRLSRRDFFSGAVYGSLAAYLLANGFPIMAGPFGQASNSLANPIPLDKKLSKTWLENLYLRGNPSSWRGWEQLKYIGMPMGGIATGTVYLGGDGKLWCWDIFNEHHFGVVPRRAGREAVGFDYITHRGGGIITEHSGLNYIDPPAQESPWHFEQGFRVVIGSAGKQDIRPLDRRGFSDIEFTGQPPIAEVVYRDSATPVRVKLEAYTPYIPLNTEDSSYPAVVMRYTVTNTGEQVLPVAVEGWTENPALMQNIHRTDGVVYNKTFSLDNGAGVIAAVRPSDYKISDKLSNLESLPDFGSLAIACLDEDARASSATFLNWYAREYTDYSEVNLFGPLAGGVSRQLELQPGESREVVFVVAWYYPNARIETAGWTQPDPVVHFFDKGPLKRWYANKFDDAQDVVKELSANLDRLTEKTRRWRDSWYDSSLPHWLLERTLITANALQTNTCYRFDDGRFWAWEGVGCCPGTCTHVWHYAQSVGRLFPDLERDLRKRTDFGIALRENGAIDFRGEWEAKPATDGQAGVILRTYREHQMSRDDSFLKSVWPECKRAIRYSISEDARGGSPDGIPEGKQHNTLDAEWFGKIPAMASLYLAALAAGEAMATDMGDISFARECRRIAALGRRNILRLFDKQRGFFVQEEDPNHSEAIGVGKGCYIDQVIGQWWACQLGLGRIYDGALIRQALGSLWDYNFCPDVGKLRDSIENPQMKGRPYAIAGDAGLIMCTWPKGGRQENWQDYWQYSYFQECMTGFEYQVASHMIWESDEQPDLLEKGLAITRAIHDRYDARLRNPYNEIECSDHYARAMAGYSVFLACCGFEYDGPKGYIGFKPRLSGSRFKAAFTAAEGWGSFSYCTSNSAFTLRIHLGHGELAINRLTLRLPETARSFNGQWQLPKQLSERNVVIRRAENDVIFSLGRRLRLKESDVLELTLGA